MRAWILAFLAGAALVQAAEPTITIRGIDRARSGGWCQVENGWHMGLDLVRVRFEVSESRDGKLPMHAQFFDGAKNPLLAFRNLPRLQVRGTDYQSLPNVLAARKVYDVCFPVSPSIAGGSSRWKTFIVELGSGEGAVRAAYPGSTNLAEFESNSAQAANIDRGNLNVIPLIKRITRFRNGMNAWVDDGWKPGLTTLRASIRIDSGAEAGGFFARAYFFDRNNQRVFEWKKPPQVEIRLGGTYAALPPRWNNNEDYDIYFPIPGKIDSGADRWKTAIIVFGNKQAVSASAYPSGSVNLSDFDFPERDQVAAVSDSDGP